MKIIHCIFSFTIGGTESMLVDIINEQSKLNEVHLLVFNSLLDDSLLSLIDSRVNIVCIMRPPGSFNPKYVLKLNRYIINIQPDIIHLHNERFYRYLFYKKASICYTAHKIGLSDNYFKVYSAIFAISDAVKQDLLRKGKYDITTIANGIDASKIATRKEYFLSEYYRIVQVARLNKAQKGQDLLLEAIFHLKNQYGVEVQATFIGEGDDYEYLMQLTKKLNLTEQVSFLGGRSREYIYAHLRDYDMMVHPSRSEGFGLTVAEGMAVGIPVVVSTGDGPFEIIQKGEYGSFFQRGDSESCAQAIYELIIHYDQYKERTMKACRFVEENYSISQLVANYQKVYHSVSK